jgi:hypothetical protein
MTGIDWRFSDAIKFVENVVIPFTDEALRVCRAGYAVNKAGSLLRPARRMVNIAFLLP